MRFEDELYTHTNGAQYHVPTAVDFLEKFFGEDNQASFVRSNGTIIARIYERLTRASRRSPKVPALHEGGRFYEVEAAYRQGVYDTLKAIQNEL